MKFRLTHIGYFCFGAMLTGFSGCSKLVSVPEPVNTITTSETFSTEANATSAVIGIYNDMTSGYNGGSFDYGNGITTYIAGLSADEMLDFNGSDLSAAQFEANSLQSNNGYVDEDFWQPMYFDIYMCNAAVAGIQASSTLTPATKAQLTGEAMFLRAYIYFYLVNLCGEVPLVTSTAWANTEGLAKATIPQIYQQIESDLQSAETLLAGDYSISNGDRTRANKWAAAALLARVYLYLNNYAGADSAASAVIGNTNLYSLVTDPNGVFLANSTEAIWQLVPSSESYFATWEGYENIPYPDSTGNPTFYLTTTLLNAFEPGDLRRLDWVDSTNYGGSLFYFPYKYKVQQSTPGNISEFYMMLRLGEQFLIRAEAEAQEGGATLGNAITDLNTIRTRAGLGGTTASSQSQVLAAIEHERQIELFGEWGHRWLDLKRWGDAVSVLTANKGYSVPTYQLWYPIPLQEIQADPNLVQTEGY